MILNWGNLKLLCVLGHTKALCTVKPVFWILCLCSKNKWGSWHGLGKPQSACCCDRRLLPVADGGSDLAPRAFDICKDYNCTEGKKGRLVSELPMWLSLTSVDAQMAMASQEHQGERRREKAVCDHADRSRSWGGEAHIIPTWGASLNLLKQSHEYWKALFISLLPRQCSRSNCDHLHGL